MTYSQLFETVCLPLWQGDYNAPDMAVAFNQLEPDKIEKKVSFICVWLTTTAHPSTQFIENLPKSQKASSHFKLLNPWQANMTSRQYQRLNCATLMLFACLVTVIKLTFVQRLVPLTKAMSGRLYGNCY